MIIFQDGKKKGKEKVMKKIAYVLTGVSLVSLTACSSTATSKLWPFGKSDSGPHAFQPANSIAYRCEGNFRFYVRYLDKGAAVWLILPEREFALNQVGTSKVYSNGSSTLDLTVDPVTLHLSASQKYDDCKIPTADSEKAMMKTSNPAQENDSANSEEGWMDKLMFWNHQDTKSSAQTESPDAHVKPVESNTPAVASQAANDKSTSVEKTTSTETTAKEAPAPSTEKGWWQRLKFWESDSKVSAQDTKASATPAPQKDEPTKSNETIAESPNQPDQTAELANDNPAVSSEEPNQTDSPKEASAEQHVVTPTTEVPETVMDANAMIEAQVNANHVTDLMEVEPSKSLPEAADADTAILKMLEAWVNAWRTKDINAYLNFYSANFVADGMSKKTWEAMRRERLGKNKNTIQITLEDVHIESKQNKAVVSFNQHYVSGSLDDKAIKRLDLINLNGQWMIVRESVKPLK
jgi:ketosteroid isomerase-like protein